MPHPNQDDVAVQDGRQVAWYVTDDELADEAAAISSENYNIIGLQQDASFDYEQETERSSHKLQAASQVFTGSGSWTAEVSVQGAEEADAGQSIIIDAAETNPTPALNVMRMTYNSNDVVTEVLYGKAKPATFSESEPETGPTTKTFPLEGHGMYTRVRNPGGTS